MSNRGSVTLFIGPMFSGKTQRMIMAVERAAYAKKKGLIVRYAGDSRTGTVQTHDKREVIECADHRSPIRLATAERLADVLIDPTEAVVGVDEGQFYGDLVEVVDSWADRGLQVFVAALDGDDKRRPFGRVIELIPRSEQVEKLNAVCHICGHDAAFSKCLVEKSEVTLIGGAEKYISVCRECFARPIPGTETLDAR